MKTTLQQKMEFLASISIFDALDEQTLQDFSEKLIVREKPKHSYIYMPDEAATHLFFLMDGCVKIGIHSADSREVIKSVLYPNSIFGELGLTGQTHRIDYAKAMDSSVVYAAIEVTEFFKLMRHDHELCLKVFEMIGIRLLEAESRLESLVLKDARSRIIDFLKESAAKRGRQVGYETLLKHSLTQQDIANLTGTSRQTVTSVLNELRKSNLIYFNRRTILIRDLQKLS